MRCRLKVLLAERDMTQRDLIVKIKASPNTVSRLCTNQFRRVDVDTIEKLVNFFNCPLEGRDGLFVLEEVTPNQKISK